MSASTGGPFCTVLLQFCFSSLVSFCLSLSCTLVRTTERDLDMWTPLYVAQRVTENVNMCATACYHPSMVAEHRSDEDGREIMVCGGSLGGACFDDSELNEWEQINKNKRRWMRRSEDVTDAGYASCYKSPTDGLEDDLTVRHFSVEGTLGFRAWLFVPRHALCDSCETKKNLNHIKLYVRRVFIMGVCEDFTPEWLNSVKGVVDLEDLPLNISRETLLQNKILRVIKKNLVNVCLQMCAEIARKDDDYKYFYEQLGKLISLALSGKSVDFSKIWVTGSRTKNWMK